MALSDTVRATSFEQDMTQRGRCRVLHTVILLGLLLSPGFAVQAQQSDAMRQGVNIARSFRTIPNLTYHTAGAHEAKLDVYAAEAATRAPTLVYFHGGGWGSGAKERAMLETMPYLAMGWTVVNVGYRLARDALAPAAVEDARCALRFILRRAEEFNIDTSRVVVTGHSAGGHLALMAAMLPVSAGLDHSCDGQDELRVAAVVNWYGITDVADLLEGPNVRSFAVTWVGSIPDRSVLARRVSPLTYVRPGLPPIITIHGDADPTVPHRHALRLKELLDGAGVPNELVTIQRGSHGGFSAEDEMRAFAAIESFLKRAGVLH